MFNVNDKVIIKATGQEGTVKGLVEEEDKPTIYLVSFLLKSGLTGTLEAKAETLELA